MLGPGVDTTSHIAHLREAVGAEELRDPQASAAMVALDQDKPVPGQVRQALGNLAHGDVTAAGDGAGGDLERLADVEEQGAFLLEFGGGDDIDFERCFHGAQASGAAHFGNGD